MGLAQQFFSHLLSLLIRQVALFRKALLKVFVIVRKLLNGFIFTIRLTRIIGYIL